MRLLHLHVLRSRGCNGLLDDVRLTVADGGRTNPLSPICLVGPNGSGKSQLLQLVAEIFQSAWHAADAREERDDANRHVAFETIYEIGPDRRRVGLRRRLAAKGAAPIEMAFDPGLEEWRSVRPDDPIFRTHLPPLVVGYTSGDNETFSLPFFVSRGGYSDDVSKAALPKSRSKWPAGVAVPDNRLLLIDYTTHLEVLVANLLLADVQERGAMIAHAGVSDIASFRCVVQLNHAKAPAAPAGAPAHRKGVQLTDELETLIGDLKRSATCWSYDEDKEIYVLDFLVDEETRKAFAVHFHDAARLHRSLHKLALLNDLAISKSVRERLRKEIESRRFASRLPEPQDEDKIFRFEQVTFHSNAERGVQGPLDYVSLSDGEHQFAQILGMLSMLRGDDVLFLLDEPESHFNPQWRLRFTKTITELPGPERGRQELLMTTHAPFVPCDLPREQVLILERQAEGLIIELPEMETYGATFDRILAACFKVRPPISQIARDEIEELLDSGTSDEITEALGRLGPSVERSFLADKRRQLAKPD